VNPYQTIATLHALFSETSADSPRVIKLLRPGGAAFRAWLHTGNLGVCVDNLGNSPLLHWAAFGETVQLLCESSGCAKRGSGSAGRLGSDACPLDSVEGHVANRVYGKTIGAAVFRRISAIAAILIDAGICDQRDGKLCLVSPCDPTPGGFGCSQ
jgi:hypothetical protein